MIYKFRTSYLPEVRALLFGKKIPDAVSVNLTHKCNLACVYCEIGQGSPIENSSPLTYGDMGWIINEMSALRIKRLAMCGGEPFLFPGITDLVTMAGKKNIGCTITSNGLSIHKLDGKCVETLKKYRTRINISIDSFDESTNAITRGKASALEQALLSIDSLLKADIPVKILSVVSKYNYTRLIEVVREACKLGIPEVLFQPVIHASNYPGTNKIRGKEKINVDASEADVLADQLDQVLDFEKKHSIRTNAYRLKLWIGPYLDHVNNKNGSFFFEELLGRFYCRDLHAIMEISYDGSIMSCGLIGSNVNIREGREEGLLSLWQRAGKSTKQDLRNKQYPPECSACCHHFSRNMIASALRYPMANREMLFRILKLWFDRSIYENVKMIKAH